MFHLTKGSPVVNQRQSGRCWLFASTNVFRIAVQKKYKVPDFQLSQAHLFFYDKLEKSNYFLQNIIDTADLDIDSRLVQTLLGDPASDGGQWDMVVNLVEKYGLVPGNVYPDSENAMNSSAMDRLIVTKLREYAIVLRELINDKTVSTSSVLAVKEGYLREIYNILVISLGVPYGQDQEFVWEYVDSAGKAQSISSTPLDFYKNVVGFKPKEYFSLIHDPRNDYDQLYTVDRLNNFVKGRPIEFVNADISELKNAAIKAIKNNEPVFFCCDVGQYADFTAGFLDIDAWDYQLAFNTSLNLTKAQRLLTKVSVLTHAMVFTGVHLVDGKPVKWRVENSWGSDAGDKGFLAMSDSWFDQFVYQVVTTKGYVAPKYLDIWKSKDYKVLPRWDPFGAVA